jgi:hypothetical protein
MRRAFLLSIRLHATWFVESFGRRGRQLAPLGLRRLLLLLILFPVYLMLQGLHWLGFLLDEILFRAYRDIEVKEPLFVTGIPRSGTTFIHRTLARDTSQFTSFTTWEALLAPSITERKIIRALAFVDKAVGRPLHRLIHAMTRRLTGGFEHIHPVGLGAPEEDYLSLLPAGACFILVLAFPASRSLWQLGRFQEVPDEQRDIVVGFYKACLRKHLYVAGPGKRLLSKNAAFASWIPDLRSAFPDGRYLMCIREPRAALASQLSSLRPGVEFFGTLPAAEVLNLEFQTVFAHAYRILQQEKNSFLVDHLAVVDQRQLKADTRAVLKASLRQLAVPLTPALADSIEEAHNASRQHRSHHQHAPLSEKTGPVEFGSMVLKIYEDILNNPHA